MANDEVCLAAASKSDARPSKADCRRFGGRRKGRQELAASAEKVSQELQKTKEQAMEIISQAEKRSGELIEEAKNQAKLEGERIVTAAKAEIEQEVNRAKELLRAQVASLALAGAEQILQKEINAAAHGDMLQRLESELG